MKRRLRQKIIATSPFLIVSSVLVILHGLFFDLDFAQIKRLGFEGFFFIFVLVSAGLLTMGEIFNLEEDAEILSMKKRLNKPEGSTFR